MKTMQFLIPVAVAITVVGLTGIPAHRADAIDQTFDALATVSEGSTSGSMDVLGDLAAIPTHVGGTNVVQSEVGAVDVVIPRDPSDPIQLDDGDVGLGIGLPFADESSLAEPLAQGIFSYDSNNGTTTAVGVKADGSIQMTTTIESSSSPSEFAYALDVPDGATLSSTPDGGITISGQDGSYVAGVAPAWAVDANGKGVPTRYRIEDTTVIQEVDHQREGVAYPVVADPWLGIALISSTSWSGNTLRVYPTDYGRWGASAARSAAWDEVKAKTPGTRENTSSMTDQFLCHYDVRPITSTKPSWNLDLNRPYVNYLVLLANRCNN